MDQNTIRETTDSVIVATKIRPLNDLERKLGCQSLIKIKKNQQEGGEVIVCNSEKFKFDYVFSETDSKDFIYDEMVSDLVNLAFKGHHVAVLTYGVKDDGKTEVLGLNHNTAGTGIIAKTLDHLFLKKQQDSSDDFPVFFGFSDMGGPDITDLLCNSDPLQQPFELEKMSKKLIESPSDCIDLIQKIVSTRERDWLAKDNHKILEFSLVWPDSSPHPINYDSSVIMSRIVFVELSPPDRLELEENYENEEMFSLLKAIHEDLPNRDLLEYSRLTAYLQNNLCGDSTTILLGCVSGSDASIDQSYKILQKINQIKSWRISMDDVKNSTMDQAKTQAAKSKLVQKSLSGVFQGLLLASHYDPSVLTDLDQKIKRRYFQHGTRASLSIELLNSVRRNIWVFGPQTLNQAKREMWVYQSILQNSLTTEEEELVPQLLQIKADLLKKRIKFKDYKEELLTLVSKEKEKLTALRKVIEIFENDDDSHENHKRFGAKNSQVIFELAKKMLKIIDNARNQQQLKKIKMSELRAQIQSPETLLNLYKRLCFSDVNPTESIFNSQVRSTSVLSTVNSRFSSTNRRRSVPTPIKNDNSAILEALKYKLQYAFATKQWFCDTLYLLTNEKEADRLEQEKRHLILTILDAKMTIKEMTSFRAGLAEMVDELKRKNSGYDFKNGLAELKLHIGYLTDLISNFQELIIIGTNLSKTIKETNQ